MIVDKLNFGLITFDYQSIEYKICEYLLKNAEDIVNKRISEVYHDLRISKSTLNRFCKKIGYRNFTELQYQLFFEKNKIINYSSHITIKEEVLKNKNLFTNKNRIIVIGDIDSISSLFAYHKVFYDKNIELLFKIANHKVISFLDEISIDKESLIIFVSLYRTNQELLIDSFSYYLDIIEYLKSKKIPYLYIGLSGRTNENEKNKIILQFKNNMCDNIYELCQIFENIYNFLAKE